MLRKHRKLLISLPRRAPQNPSWETCWKAARSHVLSPRMPHCSHTAKQRHLLRPGDFQTGHLPGENFGRGAFGLLQPRSELARPAERRCPTPRPASPHRPRPPRPTRSPRRSGSNEEPLLTAPRSPPSLPGAAGLGPSGGRGRQGELRGPAGLGLPSGLALMKTRTLLPLGTRWDGSAERLPEKAARLKAASRGQGNLPPAPAGHIPPRCRAILAGGRRAPAQGCPRTAAAAAVTAAAMRTVRLRGAAGAGAAGRKFAAERRQARGWQPPPSPRRPTAAPKRREPAAAAARWERRVSLLPLCRGGFAMSKAGTSPAKLPTPSLLRVCHSPGTGFL